MVNARIIIEAIELRGGGNLEQVFVACFVFGEQQQVRRGSIQLGIAVLHRTRRHVRFHADDRLDPLIGRGFVKVHHPEHRAMIRDSDRVHFQFLYALDEFLDVRETIEQGIFGVNVEVGEGHFSDQ